MLNKLMLTPFIGIHAGSFLNHFNGMTPSQCEYYDLYGSMKQYCIIKKRKVQTEFEPTIC